MEATVPLNRFTGLPTAWVYGHISYGVQYGLLREKECSFCALIKALSGQNTSREKQIMGLCHTTKVTFFRLTELIFNKFVNTCYTLPFIKIPTN